MQLCITTSGFMNAIFVAITGVMNAIFVTTTGNMNAIFVTITGVMNAIFKNCSMIACFLLNLPQLIQVYLILFFLLNSFV